MSRSYLRLTYHQKVQNTAEADLVCIPDLPFKIGNIPWHSIDWPCFLSKIITVDTTAYIFDYEVTLTDPFDWHSLLKQCDQLFGELERLRRGRQNKAKPILFVCERLGGIFFKETLLKIQARSHLHRGLANEISGVVFLATPHSIDEDEKGRAKFVTILRRAYKEVKDSVLSWSDLALLSLISQRFEELPFDLPLLTVSESQPTRLVQSRIIAFRKSAVLVDHRYAKTNLQAETLTCSDIPVGDLAKLQRFQSRVHKDISDFLDKTANAAVQELAKSPELPPTPQVQPSSVPQTNSESSLQTTTPKRPQVGRLSNGSTSSSSDAERSNTPTSDGSYEIVPSSYPTSAISVKDVALPFYHISPHTKNEDFYPRPRITSAIEQHLLPGTRGRAAPHLKTFVLYGPAGHGKTELAVSFFFAHRDEFDVMIFFHGDDKNKLDREMTDSVIGLGLLDASDAISSPALCYNEFISWLEYPVKKPMQNRRQFGRGPLTSPETTEFAKVLLVFDNADDPHLVLKSCWPRNGLCSVLVTSQSPLAMSKQYFGTDGFEVGPLSEQQGMEMLSQLTSGMPNCSGLDAQTMKAIILRLNGFPLAIAGASSMINSQQLSLGDFKEFLHEENGYEEFLTYRIGGRIQRGYRHENVGGAASLDSPDQTPRALLCVASFLDPDRISESILTAEIDAEALEDTQYPKSKSAFRNARTVLLHRSVLKRNHERKELWLHRIPRDLTLALLRDDPEEMRNLFDIAVLLVRSQWPSSIGASVGKWSEVKRWESCSALYIHIRRIWSAFSSNAIILSSMKHIRALIELFADAGRYQYEVANATESHLMIDAALGLCDTRGVDFLFLKSYAYGVRALLYLEHNDGQKGYLHAGIWVGIEKELFDHTEKYTGQYAAAHNAMGVACAKCGLFSKAKKYLKRSQEVREGLDGFKPSNNFSPLRELGRIALAQGEYRNAEEILSMALKDREADLGVGDVVSERTGTLLYALGNAYEGLGNSGDSFKYHTRALIQFRATVGNSHPVTAMALYKMAGHNMAFGYPGLTKALEYLDQALRIYEVREYQRPQYARCLYRKSLVFQSLGNPASQECVDAAIDIYSEVVPGPPVDPNMIRESDFDSIVAYDIR